MRTRIIRNGVYQWSENVPALYVPFRTGGYDPRPANVIGSMQPIFRGSVTMPTQADVERAQRKREAKRARHGG